MNPDRPAFEERTDRWQVGLCSILGISACLGDMVMTHLLGTWYPGYRPFFQPMSDLGDVGSPVAFKTSVWWVVMGLLFIGFGYGFHRAYSRQGKAARAAAWMLALYGIGEGLGSGLSPRTPGRGLLSPLVFTHNITGTMGVAGAVILPFMIVKIFHARQPSRLYWYSWFTTVAGGLFLLLFVIAFLLRPAAGWLSYVGLWQRLFMLTYYLYFICLAVLMLARRHGTLISTDYH